MKHNKQYLSILILLIGLSGCGQNKKNSTKKSSFKKNKVAALNIPVAHESQAKAQETSINNFFHFDPDIAEFVSLAKEETQNIGNATYAHNNNNMPNDTKDYAWMNRAPQKEEEFKAMYFGFDEHSLSENQKENIKNNALMAQNLLAEARKNNTELTFVVEGHACRSTSTSDNGGSSVYNLALSEKRSKEAANQLAAFIPQEHIKCVGRGFEIPAIVNGKAVDGNKDQQWPNRRVEIHALYS